MELAEFNSVARDVAVDVLRPCIDVRRWYEQIADARPYASVDALLTEATHAARPFTTAEVDAALAHHPRIGERAEGEGVEASLSRAEQAGVSTDASTQAQLREGNLAYERRFGRVFLIRAAGRTAEEILSALRKRLTNTDEAEEAVVAQQLREIALLRLKGAVTP